MIVKVPFKNKSFDSSSKTRGARISGDMYFKIQMEDGIPKVLNAFTKYKECGFNHHQQSSFKTQKGLRKEFHDKFKIPFNAKEKKITNLNDEMIKWWEKKMTDNKYSPLSISKHLTGNNPTGSQYKKKSAELIVDGGKYDGLPFFNLFRIFTNKPIKSMFMIHSDTINLEEFLNISKGTDELVSEVIEDFFNMEQVYFYIDEMRNYIGIVENDPIRKLRNRFRKLLIHNFERKDQFYNVFTAPKMVEAAHIKPVAHSKSESKEQEICDINNGLLLSPDIHKLFDSGALSFGDKGQAIYKTNYGTNKFAISKKEVQRLELNNYYIDKKLLSEERLSYLSYHRKHVYQVGI